ncbi:HAD hydrolase family protein [Staphylococcus aureus]
MKVVDNYDAIENIPGELIMKILAFDKMSKKIDKASKILAESPNLAISSSSRGNIRNNAFRCTKRYCARNNCRKIQIEMKEVMSIGDNLNIYRC